MYNKDIRRCLHVFQAPNSVKNLGPVFKLTTSLVNDSLKLTLRDTQICWIFCWKNVSSFCSAKATHIFSAKNIRILYIESAKTVNEMTLNELVKLTMLFWTTGPCITTKTTTMHVPLNGNNRFPVSPIFYFEIMPIQCSYDVTVHSRCLEFQETLWNTSRYPYLEISDLQKWGKQ